MPKKTTKENDRILDEVMIQTDSCVWDRFDAARP